MEEIVKILCQKRKGEASNGTTFWVISKAFIGTEGVYIISMKSKVKKKKLVENNTMLLLVKQGGVIVYFKNKVN